MGFFANIIRDSRRAITTDVRIPEVSSAPILTPLAEQGASELIRYSNASQTVEGSESRSQPAMPLEAKSGLKTKGGRPLSTTSPKHPQAVQPGIKPSPDVIQARLVSPKSVADAGSQSMGEFPLKETRTSLPANSTTRPQNKVSANLVSATPGVSVHRTSTTHPLSHEHQTVKPSKPNDERRVAPHTTKSPQSNDDFIGALSPPVHLQGQDVDVVDDVQEMAAVKASNVRHASMVVPVSAPEMPDRFSQGKPDATHAERTAVADSTRVQIGQINIVVEGPSDSKRQPVRPSSPNDLASRTFLRSL